MVQMCIYNKCIRFYYTIRKNLEKLSFNTPFKMLCADLSFKCVYLAQVFYQFLKKTMHTMWI